MDAPLDWQKWIAQSLPRTDYVRGGATIWRRGDSGLLGDSLGPIMHLHDDAAEIFFFLAGRCRLEIGEVDEICEAGDYVLVPPGVPHNLWSASDDDLLVFWAVAPHFQANKWRTDNFGPGAMTRRAVRGRVQAGAKLPSDAHIRSQLVNLSSGQAQASATRTAQEAIIYIVAGAVEVQVGKLSGPLAAHDFVHVPVGTAYRLSARGEPALALLLEMPG